MKKSILLATILMFACSTFAESYKETFDGNSLGWTECTFNNNENIKMIIDKGVLTVHSEKNTDFWTGNVSWSYAESFCYAPIDVKQSFKIIAHLRYENSDVPCGIRFNEKDDGTFYALSFIEDNKKIYFQRFVDNKKVGGHTQGFPFPKLKKGEWYEVVIENNGNEISVSMQGIPVFTLRYMPIDYSGISFFTIGEQEMTIDDIEFIQ